MGWWVDTGELEAENTQNGGERGIRTPGSLSTSTVFKTAALNHSAISPIFIVGGPCTPTGNLRSLSLRSGCYCLVGGPCTPTGNLRSLSLRSGCSTLSSGAPAPRLATCARFRSAPVAHSVVGGVGNPRLAPFMALRSIPGAH